MEEELRALLRATTAVTDICGARINWVAHPQGQPYPAVVLGVVGDSEGHTLKGPDGLSKGRVQVDCYGDDYDAAKLLGRAVRASLDGYRGGNFSGVFLAGSREDREGGTNEANRPFRVSLDFLTNWSA